MPHPELTVSLDPIGSAPAEALVLALPSLDDRPDALDDLEGLQDALESIGFTGAANAFARVHAPAVSAVPLAVVGMGGDPDEQAVREAAGTAIRSLTGFESVALAVIDGPPDAWRAAAEGAALGGYSFTGYKTDPGKPRASRVLVHAPQGTADSELDGARSVAEAVALTKDLANTPADRLGPADLADRAVEAARGLDIAVEVLDEKALAEGGYGGILGVGNGSDRPPRMIRLDYSPAEAERHIAVVGKGIVFDTGGLSLKPPASMVGMKDDMAGAATALAVVRAAASLALPVRVTAWLCVAENMPSGRATRPGDVLRTLDGTTVEVLNTDAEGRLVLADGLAAASRERPDVIVDVATLTGAMVVALGTRHTGVMGTGSGVQAFLDAAERTGELAWPLPLPDHMVSDLESPIADLRNAKVGDRAAGSLFAGLFLRHFVGRVSDEDGADRIDWVHLDIAGSSTSDSPWGYTDKGSTGATVRALVDFVAAGGSRR